MWAGKGPRIVRQKVQFSENFRRPPIVSVGLTMWDISAAANSRADLKAEKITETGFVAVFRTWEDTQVARVRVGWQAIGELAHGDEWELY